MGEPNEPDALSVLRALVQGEDHWTPETDEAYQTAKRWARVLVAGVPAAEGASMASKAASEERAATINVITGHGFTWQPTDRLDQRVDSIVSGLRSQVTTGRSQLVALRDATPAPTVAPDDDDAIDEMFEFVAFAGGPDPDDAAIGESFGYDRAAAEERARWLVDGGVAWRRDPEATAGPWGLIDGWQDPDGESWIVRGGAEERR